MTIRVPGRQEHQTEPELPRRNHPRSGRLAARFFAASGQRPDSRTCGGRVNQDSRDDCGRLGLSYWQILVLAAVRLGCNFDDDRLQNLAEEHRTLRMIMGSGDWDDDTNFGWRRIRDNVCLLKPETIER